MKRKISHLIIILLIVFLLSPTVYAKSMKATDFIQKIADDAGGNPNSIEVIGDTGLAYDGTVDKNLRYVGATPNNYIKFNDELWRIIGVMNNVEDENGNKAPKIKLVRYESIGNHSWDKTKQNETINGAIPWSRASVYKLLNPGFENNMNGGLNNTELVNNSLYWNRKSGRCIINGNTQNSIACDFTKIGLKSKYRDFIENIKWKIGFTGSDYRAVSFKDVYNNERQEIENFESEVLGKVGLLYASDYGFSTSGDAETSRDACLNANISSWGNWVWNEVYYTQCRDSSWMSADMKGIWLLTRNVIDSYGSAGISGGALSNRYSIFPNIYLKSNVKIVDGSGSYKNPYIIADGSYTDKEINSTSTNSKYKGDYSIESLSKNYNIITFGTQDNNLETQLKQTIGNTKKGDLRDIKEIEGPVLVNGNYTLDNDFGTFATKSTDDESFIKGTLGDNLKTPAKIVTNKDYVNFDEMYAQVVNEQQLLVEKTNTHLNANKMEITAPGIYMINNTLPNNDYVNHYYRPENRYYEAKKIYIDNYDKNNNYIFNIMNLFVIDNYEVYIKSSNDPSFVRFSDFVESEEYTGNIIFNYPNARYINLTFVSGKIIAPKADIYLDHHTENHIELPIYEPIFANSITGTKATKIMYSPKKSSNQVLKESGKQYVVEPEDYKDDLYTGNYSLKGLLENYNIISFGKKDYDSKSKFNTLEGYKNGSVGLFHIASQFLINGDLGIPDFQYDGGHGYYGNNAQNSYGYISGNAIRLDSESNLITESYLSGVPKRITSFKYWGDYGTAYSFGTKNTIYANSVGAYYYGNEKGGFLTQDSFINFDRLYDNITTQQKEIKQGQDVKVQNGKAHIKVGSNYVINDINEIDEIIFDNFDDNKDKMTMITINNTGDINFPKMSADTIGLIETNDYYGKSEATYQYEIDRDFTEKYHGNIVWNIPNATYIKLAANAPFAGHLIAPKADVETPELHFSGCFIVNSLYCEGNTEAHFYPLTATEMDEAYMDEDGNLKIHRIKVSEALGEDASIIEKKVVGDLEAYRRDENPSIIDKIIDPIQQLLVNPSTNRNVIFIFLAVIVSVAGIVTVKKKKKI